MFVSSREIVGDFLIYEESDGTIINVVSSNEALYADKPVSKDSIRAECPLAGWILKPDKNNPNKTWCTLLMEFDFAGYVPDFVVK